MRTPKQVERECSGCRQKKILIHRVAGMGYCERCKHKAPKSQKELQDFCYENSLKNPNIGFTIHRWGKRPEEVVS
jgi:hypothetical protein